jgi:membrane protease YdiL (CAAX protease family)
MPRNLLFFANLKYLPAVPWSVPLLALWLWLFWRYVRGAGPPASTATIRAVNLRAHPLPVPIWLWSLAAGAFGLVALVFALRLLNRVVTLPVQQIPDLHEVAGVTMAALLAISAPIAGVVEEAAFRGYMQRPIEQHHGLPIAILVTGTMFALVHLDFTLILWPYYLAVAALYGTITKLTGSILPAIVLHTGGNLYSNFGLWLHGQAEWQAPAGPHALLWKTGLDRNDLSSSAALVFAVFAMAFAFNRLAGALGRPVR